MKQLLAVGPSLLLVACSVYEKAVYQSADPTYREEGKVCGGVPYSQANVPLSDKAALRLSLAEANAAIDVNIEVQLLKGETVRFERPSVELVTNETRASGVLRRWEISVLGRDGKPGYLEHVSPTEELRALGRNEDLATEDTAYLRRDIFASSAHIPLAPAETLSLHLSSFTLNGRPKTLAPVVFKRSVKTAVHGLCP